MKEENKAEKPEEQATTLIVALIKETLKNIRALPDQNSKIRELRETCKIILNRNDEHSEVLRDELFEQIKPEVGRLKTYFSHLTIAERVFEIRQYIKLFRDEQLAKVVVIIESFKKL